MICLNPPRDCGNETESTTNILLGTFLIWIAALLETKFHLINKNLLRGDVFFILLLFMGIFSTGFAYIWWYHGVKKIGAVKTAIFMNVVPFLAILSSSSFIKESLGIKF